MLAIPVYRIGKAFAISAVAMALLLNYSRQNIGKLCKQGKFPAYRYKKKWYIIIPNKKLSIPKIYPKEPRDIDPLPLPGKLDFNLDWDYWLGQLPDQALELYEKFIFTYIQFRGSTWLMPTSPLALVAKETTSLVEVPFRLPWSKSIPPLNLGMSKFNNGGGSLASENLPAALFEAARFLNNTEATRNAANPGLAPRANTTLNISFDTGLIAIAATLPFSNTQNEAGQQIMTPIDYLGSQFSVFNPGTNGSIKATTSMKAFVDIATLVAAAEKLVQPTDAQPNNVQIAYDLEVGNLTVTANLPFTATANDDGAVVILATDYLE